MAKEQNISINPAKISGVCGRLMCCLKYEHEVYEEKLKIVPKVGAIVNTPLGQGTVMQVSLLKESIKVKLDNDEQAELKSFGASEVVVIKDVVLEENEADLEELKKLED
jgi:cell fate regulator YaaT (PSP1 superfamily)